MNLLDIIIIIVMVFFIIRGILRGVFMEIASFAGIILGILFGLRFNPTVTKMLHSHIPSFDPIVLQLIGFAIIFTLCLVLCNLTGWLIKTILKKSSFGWMDNALGACLALVKGIVIIYLALILITFFVSSKAPLVARSTLAPIIMSSYQTVMGVVSPEFYLRWKNKFMGQKELIGKAVSKKIEKLKE